MQEFGDRHEHLLIIMRALHGLRSSGAQWHDKFSDCLRELGFQPCKAEPDIYLRKNGEKYEYVAVYVDDIAIAMENPQALINSLTETYKFKLKGTGPISYHLGMDLHRDKDGVLCIAPRKYLEQVMANYECIFGKTHPNRMSHPHWQRVTIQN
jgi:Reverse transcriptase (RNA-dependent DNA polymerase)